MKKQPDGTASSQSSLFPDDGDVSAEPKRKLQLCNGYLLEFDKLSRVMSAIRGQKDAHRISRESIIEATGLPNRQVETVVSMGAAMGLIVRGVQVLTRVGDLVATHDAFFERTGTMEWCHYEGAGSFRNLVWFDVFNRILTTEAPSTQAQWNSWFRRELAGRYSDRTLRKVIQEEVRFVVDAYQVQRFSGLDLLEMDPGKCMSLRHYLRMEPAVLCAMLYDFAERHQGRIFELSELARIPGSPAVVFGIDQNALRSLVEGLHDRGWLRYETTHNLDQIRLKPGFDATEFINAYYGHREPVARDSIPGVYDE